ncbi:MAG: MarR family transcriptional regulator [Odoribacter sp.]|nr:MarR family transcriptional regulator [Odoribacter sp.]
MQNYIDTLRQLNYELVKELGLFGRRAGLSFSQRHILYHIKNEAGLSIQELADFLHVEHSTMSRNIKKLVQSGLADMFQDEKDRRRKVVLLTEQGAKKLEEATQSINQTIFKVTGILNKQEIETIIESLKIYCTALK